MEEMPKAKYVGRSTVSKPSPGDTHPKMLMCPVNYKLSKPGLFGTAIRNRSVLESQEQDSYFLEEYAEFKSQWVADEVTFHL